MKHQLYPAHLKFLLLAIAFILTSSGCGSVEVPGYECDENDEIFNVVEKMPELANASRLNAVATYPEAALRDRVEGRVITRFIINRIGVTEDVVIAEALCPRCDEEALRLIRMARFAPGLQRGDPSCMQMSLPVTFSLADTSVTVPDD